MTGPVTSTTPTTLRPEIPTTLSPERESTDDSLRAERNKTDAELGRKRAVVEQKAHAVVEHARDKTDAAVQDARDRADHGAQGQTAPEARSLEKQRASEDEALQDERRNADVGMHRERDERERALASVLHLERESTDEHLLVERGRSDETLNTRDIFLAMVSHDLRNLLGGIILSAEMLATELPTGVGAAASVRPRTLVILRAAARMNRIIGDLVDIASIEAGQFVVEPVQQDLMGLVKEAITTFQLAADARAIELVLEVGDQAPPALAPIDHDRIVQVLANLLTNAIKFTAVGGRITVRVQALADAVRVSIADTGCGIPAEHLEAIFGRFWQVSRTDRRGLGLGLYICRCILEGHRGRIWAESVVGAGATLSFTLPRA